MLLSALCEKSMALAWTALVVHHNHPLSKQKKRYIKIIGGLIMLFTKPAKNHSSKSSADRNETLSTGLPESLLDILFIPYYCIPYKRGPVFCN